MLYTYNIYVPEVIKCRPRSNYIEMIFCHRLASNCKGKKKKKVCKAKYCKMERARVDLDRQMVKIPKDKKTVYQTSKAVASRCSIDEQQGKLDGLRFI